VGLSSREEWNISQLKPKDMDLIIKYLGYPDSDLWIGRKITKREALDMKTTGVHTDDIYIHKVQFQKQ